ncbi:MAG: acetyl-CoA carboxylase, carboxyltransferase subunit beta [bacterium]|nr:acetyl-CoA carboxylase, carboxyltransferase subunit beta [bacterium]
MDHTLWSAAALSELWRNPVWFKRENKPKEKIENKKLQIPQGLWIRCKNCKEIIYKKEVERNFDICPKCQYHFYISAQKRLSLLYDQGEYNTFDDHLQPTDPLKFRDRKKYRDRLKEYAALTGLKDAIISSEGTIGGYRVVICAMEFGFMGGSMASVVGEKIVRGAERCLAEKIPLITIACSGGARMQEGIISLMQMAKTSAAVGKLAEAGLPFISILTDPTTGGVSASFAMLGDIIISEPKALIGFAGQRVIEQTIGQELPPGFQTAEFLLAHGMIDMIVDRRQMRSTLIKILSFFALGPPPQGPDGQ